MSYLLTHYPMQMFYLAVMFGGSALATLAVTIHYARRTRREAQITRQRQADAERNGFSPFFF